MAYRSLWQEGSLQPEFECGCEEGSLTATVRLTLSSRPEETVVLRNGLEEEDQRSLTVPTPPEGFAVRRPLLLPALTANALRLRNPNPAGAPHDVDSLPEELNRGLMGRAVRPLLLRVLCFYLDQTFAMSSIRDEVNAVCGGSYFLAGNASNVGILCLRLAVYEHLMLHDFARDSNNDPFDGAMQSAKDASKTQLLELPSGLHSLLTPKGASLFACRAIVFSARCKDIRTTECDDHQQPDALTVGPHRTTARRHSAFYSSATHRIQHAIGGASLGGTEEAHKPRRVPLVVQAHMQRQQSGECVPKKRGRKEQQKSEKDSPASPEVVQRESSRYLGSGLAAFPPELQRMVLLYLTPRALVCAEATCRLWHALISRTQGLLRMVMASREVRAVYTAFMEEEWGERCVSIDPNRLSVSSARMVTVAHESEIKDLLRGDAAAGDGDDARSVIDGDVAIASRAVSEAALRLAGVLELDELPFTVTSVSSNDH